MLCDLRKHGVRLRDILAQQGVGLRIQCGGMGFVGHQLCVDEHVQAGGLQGSLAQYGGAACIGHGQRAALGCIFFHKCNAFGALAHDFQRHGTGSIQCGFLHSGLVSRLLRSVLGQAIGSGQRRKGFGIRLHQCFQLCAQGTGPLVQGQNVRFHGGILLFAHRQAAHHVAQCHTGGTHQCRGTAAARCGCFAGQFCQEPAAAFVHHVHVYKPLSVTNASSRWSCSSTAACATR